MRSVISMRWSEIPCDAKAYMLYHTIIAPQLIVWTLLPLYMMYSGYSVLEVGAFFTAVNIISIPLTYLFGRAFNHWDIKKGLIAIDALDGIAYVLYGFAKGAIAPLMLFAGRTIEKFSTMLYPLYRAYEQIIYPEDRYEEIFAWHLRLPEIARLVTFPILGYLFGYVFPKPEHYRLAFIFFGLLSIATMTYIWLFLPSVGKEERITPKGFTFKAGEFKLLLTFEALLTIAWELAPEIILINYVVFVASEKVPREKGFQAIGFGMFLNAVYALIMTLSPPFWLALAGALASVHATVPYGASLFAFIAAGVLLLWIKGQK